MLEPFIGQIVPVAFQFAPRGWALCNGQLLPINQNQALFALLGTQYGGNGTTNFALPDLRGRTPVHVGTGPGLPPVVIGERGGVVAHALTFAELPAHSHARGSQLQATSTSPVGNVLAVKPRRGVTRYAPPPAGLVLANGSASRGAGQPHENMQPYLVLNYVIALVGVFPSQS